MEFTPFELVYGHSPRGFLKLVKDKLLTDDQDHEKCKSVIQYICQLKDKVREACKLAKDHLGKAQTKMKIWYEHKAKDRKYSHGDKVMALLPEPHKNLLAQYSEPYTILQKVGNLDYIISTPHRRRYTHVNMLKPYYTRDDKEVPVASSVNNPPIGDNDDFTVTEANIKLDNSILLADTATKIKSAR